MKKRIIIFLLILCSGGLYAQEARRLFLVDEYHGNYSEIAMDKEITFSLNPNQETITGKIIELTKDKLIFENLKGEISEIPVDLISTIISNRKSGAGSSSLVLFFKYVGGTIMIIYAVPIFIAGIAETGNDPILGAVAMVAGAGLGYGGTMLIRSANRSRAIPENRTYQIIDGVRYHLLIK